MVQGSGTLRLGSLTVSRLGYGTMRLTGPGVWGPPPDHDTAIALLRRAVDLGVDLIDTADSYGPFVAEELIREALAPYAEPVASPPKPGTSGPVPMRGCPWAGPSTSARSAR